MAIGDCEYVERDENGELMVRPVYRFVSENNPDVTVYTYDYSDFEYIG